MTATDNDDQRGADPQRPLRRDAARNAERVSAAAMQVFAERGLEVSMADVAEKAGVGVGTVYRRFGDKGGLIDTLFASEVAELADFAESAQRHAGDPATAFTDFFLTLCDRLAANRGLRQILLNNTFSPSELHVSAIENFIPHAERLIAAAREAGWLRQEFATTDLLLVLTAVGAVRDLGGTDHPDLWRRMMSITIDGIRADSRNLTDCHVPGPLRDDEIRRAKGAHRRDI